GSRFTTPDLLRTLLNEFIISPLKKTSNPINADVLTHLFQMRLPIVNDLCESVMEDLTKNMMENEPLKDRLTRARVSLRDSLLNPLFLGNTSVNIPKTNAVGQVPIESQSAAGETIAEKTQAITDAAEALKQGGERVFEQTSGIGDFLKGLLWSKESRVRLDPKLVQEKRYYELALQRDRQLYKGAADDPDYKPLTATQIVDQMQKVTAALDHKGGEYKFPDNDSLAS